MDFIDASPGPYHAVEHILTMLEAAGARRLDERAPWELEPGALYYVPRAGTSVVAFRMGLQNPAEHGFLIAGAHTDSPALKVRPEKPLVSKGYVRLAVESYGAPILSGWLDRPLGIAGVLAVSDAGTIHTRLYASHVPAAVIPNLAIHLNRDINKGFEYNLHQHMPAIIGLAGERNMQETGAPPLLARICEELEIDPAKLISVDLRLYDPEPCKIVAEEIINGPRLDDLAGCMAIAQAFSQASACPATQLACFFDAEEIGSMTLAGAQSSFLRDVLARILLASRNSGQDYYQALARSSCVSVDAAQAIHPGYPDKFDEYYSPVLGAGIAVKMNANMNYATDFTSLQIAAKAAQRAGIEFQRYMARADMQPGKTIGPITASRTGIATVDVGHPMLAMHAIRETIAASDHRAMVQFLEAFFAGA